MTERHDQPTSPLLPETLAALSTFSVRVRKVVEGFLGGSHSSLHFGASVEFAEHKKYSPGDDIRHIDWRALARTDRYFVKQQQREVILRCLLVLDLSASMAYQGSRAIASKLAYAAELEAALAYVLMRQGDEAGLLFFAEGIRRFVPPSRRPGHLKELFAAFVAATPSTESGTALHEAITLAAERAGRRAMVVIATDLWSSPVETEAALTKLASRGHDIALFHILDPDEIDLPFRGPSTFVGMEDEHPVHTDPALVREAYCERLAAEQSKWRHLCGEAGIDLYSIRTDEPISALLAEFARRRSGIRRRM
ncbi:MAG: DUF58 domain-containing protein [Myxococcota bacterium]|jgi:uncharacterized protein (DUF58 family)|nr:DUF58 domain-containing protein [Myxococcota bacterium]